ncbi:MAG: epoxyqueuosine reductase [Planctomycetota bacterium]|jgi:epoxyqueuosine reductase
MDRTQLAFEIAHSLGFELSGATPLAPPKRAEEFEAWLAEGHHGSMDYLERQKSRILDPGAILEQGRSLLVVGLGHSRAPIELPGGARVARYAAGRDYHNWISKRLGNLRRKLDQEGFSGPFRGIVDAGPLMERSHAAQAGLGAESKAANLLAPDFGPWFFLGELLMGEELEPTAPAQNLPNCGTCTACIDECPTGAIVAPGQVDARRCISYLTIEERGPIAHELRAEIGPWVFGCDVCSEVCPWGTKAPDKSSLFGTHPMLEAEGDEPEDSPIIAWLVESDDFRERFNGSPLQRPRREGLARNAAIVLGNLPSEAGRAALLQALANDDSPIVRAASGWALAHGYANDEGVPAALGAALGCETDEVALADLQRSLDEESAH